MIKKKVNSTSLIYLPTIDENKNQQKNRKKYAISDLKVYSN